MSLNLSHFLELTARQSPDKAAVTLDGEVLTFSDVHAGAQRVARLLESRGIGRGDQVAMVVPNAPLFPVLYYGILRAGATAVPLNVLCKAPEIQYHLADSEAKAAFVWHTCLDPARRAFEDADACSHLFVAGGDAAEYTPVGEHLAPLLAEIPPESDLVETMPDDTAVILYTSGTTGRPKGAELTHFNMFFNAYYAWHHIMYVQPDDVVLGVLPLFHSFGQTCVMNAAFMAGATVALAPTFSPDATMALIQREKVSVIAMVPTMYFYLLNVRHAEQYDLSSLHTAVSGGSSLPVETLHAFQERYGVGILEGYGLSETSPAAAFNVKGRPCKPGSIGLPIWGTQMRVMREDGTFADVGEVGEIVIRGHNVMKGYYKCPAATREVIVDGWFHTGDLARMDEDGYFFIVDRKKDLIIRGGANVYPREVEEVLYGHPAVLEAAVVGVPDDALGERVKAYVVLKADAQATRRDLDAHCRDRLAGFKCPRSFEFMASLPKGPTGKILKRELRGATSEPER